MELNEIKKLLYKHKPIAELTHVNKSCIGYITIRDGEVPTTSFRIPIEDIGDGIFLKHMPAQQLIRWLVIPETN